MILRSLLLFTLQLLVASQRVLRSFAFSPIVPPRFDNFCEQVIGAWGISSNSEETKYVGDVEEVMRSCGGAVQGIREVPQIVDSSSSSAAAATQDHRLYHNRADDGFIYFDCGSYSQGPVQLKDTNAPDPSSTQVGCLTFSTMPKSRILFDSSSGTWQTLVRGPKSQMLLSDENACLQPTGTHGDDAESVGLDASVAWGKDIVCRMPNNQPWMLQRVKWQQSIVNESNIISDKLKIEPDELKVTGWIKKWNNSDDNIVNMNDDLRNQLGSSTLDDFLLENTSEIVQFGAACKTSGEIKCILRCYDEGGMLKGIILQQGKLITEEGRNESIVIC
jgi:hypothetical protein